MVAAGPVMLLKPNEKLVQKARNSSIDNEANAMMFGFSSACYSSAVRHVTLDVLDTTIMQRQKSLLILGS